MTEVPPSGRGRARLASELDYAVKDVEGEGGIQTAFLVGLTGRYAGKLFRLKAGENLIGRSSSSFVCLDEKATSNQHAKLLLNSRGCYILDLESTNGTYVNDVRIDSVTGLQAGDVIRCGSSNFGFLTDAEDEGQHTRAMARLAAPTATGKAGALPGLVRRRAGGVPALHSVHEVSSAPIVVERSAVVLGDEQEGGLLNTLDVLLDRIAVAWALLKSNWKLLLASAVFFASLGAGSVEIHLPPSEATSEVMLRAADPRQKRNSDRLVEYFDMATTNWATPNLVLQTMKDMRMSNLGPGALKTTAHALFVNKGTINTYELGFRNSDPRFAEQFLAAHVKNFLEAEIGKAIAVVKSEVDLLAQQHQSNEDRLRALEARLADFKEKNSAVLPENVVGELSARPATMGQRDMLTAQLGRYTQELALARRTLASGSFQATSSAMRTAPYEQSLIVVKQDLASLQAKGFSDSHPQVVQLQGRRRELEALITEARTAPQTEADRLADVAYQQQLLEVGRLEVLVNSTREELGLVENRLKKSGDLAARMPQVEVEYADLQRRLDAAKEQNQTLGRRLKDKELQLELERASVAARYEILQQPHAYSISKPKTALKRAAAGAFGGLVFGVLVALVRWLLGYSRQRAEVRMAIGTSLARRDS